MSTETTEYRIAGAPISWGVCEVPGWGYQLGPDKVLAEMREVGLLATELGPDGFLPAEPDAMATVLAQHGLQAVGGFTPLLLHVPSHDPVPEVERILEGYVASNASTLVLSSVSGQDGYDSRPELDDKGWQTLLDNLSRISQIAAAKGIRAVLHPHVGTMIENTAEVQRVLDGLVDQPVPGHRAPAHRRHRPRRAHPTGARAGRARPLQGRRREQGEARPGRALDLHRGRHAGACTGRWAPVTSTSPRSWST